MKLQSESRKSQHFAIEREFDVTLLHSLHWRDHLLLCVWSKQRRYFAHRSLLNGHLLDQHDKYVVFVEHMQHWNIEHLLNIRSLRATLNRRGHWDFWTFLNDCLLLLDERGDLETVVHLFFHLQRWNVERRHLDVHQAAPQIFPLRPKVLWPLPAGRHFLVVEGPGGSRLAVVWPRNVVVFEWLIISKEKLLLEELTLAIFFVDFRY